MRCHQHWEPNVIGVCLKQCIYSVVVVYTNGVTNNNFDFDWRILQLSGFWYTPNIGQKQLVHVREGWG